MFLRKLSVVAVAIAAIGLGASAQAALKKADASHTGTVVSAGSGKLVMTDATGGKEHTHAVPATAKVSVDGKAGKLEDLKKGMTVSITSDAAGKVSAVSGMKAETKHAPVIKPTTAPTTTAPTTKPAVAPPAKVTAPVPAKTIVPSTTPVAK